MKTSRRGNSCDSEWLFYCLIMRLSLNYAYWQSDHARIEIDFDAEGRVGWVDSLPVRRVPESPLDMIRRWLHL